MGLVTPTAPDDARLDFDWILARCGRISTSVGRFARRPV